MNIIQEIVEKYNGKYYESDTRKFHTPHGKYEIQPQKGIINIDGTKITINKNENIGIDFNIGGSDKIFAEPYRIFFALKKNKKQLNIYPKSILKKILSKLTFKKNEINQFEFKGDKELINELIKNEKLNKNLNGETIYLSINEKYLNKLMLIPDNGIISIRKFEKYIEIMKLIEREIIKAPNKVYKQ